MVRRREFGRQAGKGVDLVRGASKLQRTALLSYCGRQSVLGKCAVGMSDLESSLTVCLPRCGIFDVVRYRPIRYGHMMMHSSSYVLQLPGPPDLLLQVQG
jgi:hypothetical protein